MIMKSMFLTAILFFISVVTAQPKREILFSMKVTLATTLGESFELSSFKVDGQTVYAINHSTNTSRLGEQVITAEVFKELQAIVKPLATTKFSTPCSHPAAIEWNNSNSVKQSLVCAENKKGQRVVKNFVEKAKGYLKLQ